MTCILTVNVNNYSQEENVKRLKTDREVAPSRYVPKVEEVYSICNARIPYLVLCNEVSVAIHQFYLIRDNDFFARISGNIIVVFERTYAHLRMVRILFQYTYLNLAF